MKTRKEIKPKPVLGLDLKRMVKTALRKTYGFGPEHLRDIHIENRAADGSYIRFIINGHRYYVLDGKAYPNEPV